MSGLRPSTLKEIETILDDSYFTKASFSIKDRPDHDPFLTIEFIPNKELKFEVYEIAGENPFLSQESPGVHMSSPEDFEHESFVTVSARVRGWTQRIKEDYDHRAITKDEIEDFLDKLRERFEQHGEFEEEEFSEDEISELKTHLSELESKVEELARQFEVSELEVSQFHKEMENVKSDLRKFPKPMWFHVSGNKIVKAVGKFLTTTEGRQMLLEAFKNLLPPPT